MRSRLTRLEIECIMIGGEREGAARDAAGTG